jgi:hypothetical protein
MERQLVVHGFAPILPMARQNLAVTFRGIFGSLHSISKFLSINTMISDETPKGVLRKMVPWNPGWKTLLYSVINERKHFFFNMYIPQHPN